MGKQNGNGKTLKGTVPGPVYSGQETVPWFIVYDSLIVS